jgi:hypothetical protein
MGKNLEVDVSFKESIQSTKQTKDKKNLFVKLWHSIIEKIYKG